MLVGEPGIGKTTLWEAGIAAAREQGLRVLAARPSGAEARLSFAALIDLLDGVARRAGRTAGAAAPALEVALLRAEPTGVARPRPHAIAVGAAERAPGAGRPRAGARSRSTTSSGSTLLRPKRWRSRRAGSTAQPVALPARERARPAHRARAGARAARARARRGGAAEPRRDPRACCRAARAEPAPAAAAPGRRRRRSATRCSRSRSGARSSSAGLPASGEDIPVPEAVEELLGTRVERLPDRSAGCCSRSR